MRIRSLFRIVAAALAFGMTAGLTASATPADDAPQIVPIAAQRYRFEPSTITLKRGQTVKLVLSSRDRIHGFMSKALGIDTDIAPGKPTEITITPRAAGTFRTICDHYCGLGHHGMKMTIVVQ
jgi:cytochrome c oxidase subunit 2